MTPPHHSQIYFPSRSQITLKEKIINLLYVHVSPFKVPAEGTFSTSAVTLFSSFFSSQLFTASSFSDSPLSPPVSLTGSSASLAAWSLGISSGSAADCSLAVSSEQELVLMEDLSGASFRACTRSWSIT